MPGPLKPPSDDFHVYDTTLRDGAQREGMSLSIHDKLTVARHLDDLGVGFIEGGWPGASPKETEFFKLAEKELDLSHATLVAFGATRKADGGKAADDPQVAALRDSGAPVVTLVAKAHTRHVDAALRTTLDENLAMIRDTVEHLRNEGQRVFVDCEHFFDGFRLDKAYALEVVRTVVESGADVAVLCDTNGGMLPHWVGEIVAEVMDATSARLGIHCHNDVACAVANSLAAVGSGATHVQGCANGYGERAGNADLFAVVANLETKLDRKVLPDGKLAELVRISHAISEVTNITPDSHQAFVGASAFAHKAGLHASAVKVNEDLYQHMDPSLVGNDMRMLVSEMAGRALIELKGKELGMDLDREMQGRVVERVKQLESQGYTFEAADASFELMLREDVDGPSAKAYELESWRVIVEHRADGEVVSEATVKVSIDGERVVSTGEGNGPVNALDTALRQALGARYPALADLELVDYKVRILDTTHGTSAITRVLVTTSDGKGEWDTIGVHENVVAASWQALQDAMSYGLLRASRSTS